MSSCITLGAVQGQGVLSEKLRSFSLQDLTLIHNEEELLDDDTHTAATLPRAKARTGIHTYALIIFILLHFYHNIDEGLPLFCCAIWEHLFCRLLARNFSPLRSVNRPIRNLS